MAMRNSLKVRYASLVFVGILLSACGTGSLTGEVGDGAASGGGGYVIPGGEMAGDWDIQVVDDNGNVGKLGELRFNGQGQPSIAYFVVSGTVYWIRYATYDGWTWEIETVHETDTMTGCGLTMDPTGRPLLTYVGGERTPLYYWPFQSDLLTASWTGADWATETVDEEGVVGLWPSVAFDRFGLAGISYQDLGTGIDYNDFHLRDLKYAYSAGGSWTTETVDLDGGGYYTNLLFDEDDQPGIAYCGNMDDDHQSVKFAHRGDFGWEILSVDSMAECSEHPRRRVWDRLLRRAIRGPAIRQLHERHLGSGDRRVPQSGGKILFPRLRPGWTTGDKLLLLRPRSRTPERSTSPTTTSLNNP